MESQSLFCVIRIWIQNYGKLCRIPRPPRVFKFPYGSFIHIAYVSSNSDHQYRSQNALTSALEARRLHESFRIILPKVSSLFPFFKSLRTLFRKLLLLEYPSFGDEKILLTALQILQLVFEKFRQTLMPVSPLTIVYFAFFSIRYRKTNVVAFSSNSPNKDTPNLSATSGFIFPTTIHNIDSSSNVALRLPHTHRIPIFFLRHPDWKTEMGEV